MQNELINLDAPHRMRIASPIDTSIGHQGIRWDLLNRDYPRDLDKLLLLAISYGKGNWHVGANGLALTRIWLTAYRRLKILLFRYERHPETASKINELQSSFAMETGRESQQHPVSEQSSRRSVARHRRVGGRGAGACGNDVERTCQCT